jgi:hypothetical protein
MRSSLMMVLLGGLAALGLMLAGCGPAEPDATPPPDPHEGHDHGAVDTAPDAITKALAGLSPADRELAEKQKTCPVSGEPLGSMGTPVKVTVEDREVFLCCAGCEGELRSDPEKYLPRLPQ